jgi:hypothetical protein
MDYATECVYCHNALQPLTTVSDESIPTQAQHIVSEYPEQVQYPQQQTSPQAIQGPSPQYKFKADFAGQEITSEKEKPKLLIVSVVAVVVIIVIITVSVLFLFPTDDSSPDDVSVAKQSEIAPNTLVSAKQLSDDWNSRSGQFIGLDNRDIITIHDKINEIEYVQQTDLAYGDVNWTIITFQSTNTVSISNFYDDGFPLSERWGLIIFEGDLTGDYKKGDWVDVQLNIEETVAYGKKAEFPDWYVCFCEASEGKIDYDEVYGLDSSRIYHTIE